MAHVQSVSANANASSVTSPAITSTAANLLSIAVVKGDGTAEAATPVDDTKSNTWVNYAAAQTVAVSVDIRGLYAKNILGGASHTVTYYLAAADYCAIGVTEFSGRDTTAPTDVSGGRTNAVGETNTHSSGSITTGFASEDVFSALSGNEANTNTYTVASPATLQTSKTDAANTLPPIAVSTEARAAAGAGDHVYTVTPNDSVFVVAIIQSFKAAASGASLSRRTGVNVVAQSINRLASFFRVLIPQGA